MSTNMPSVESTPFKKIFDPLSVQGKTNYFNQRQEAICTIASFILGLFTFGIAHAIYHGYLFLNRRWTKKDPDQVDLDTKIVNGKIQVKKNTNGKDDEKDDEKKPTNADSHEFKSPNTQSTYRKANPDDVKMPPSSRSLEFKQSPSSSSISSSSSSSLSSSQFSQRNDEVKSAIYSPILPPITLELSQMANYPKSFLGMLKQVKDLEGMRVVAGQHDVIEAFQMILDGRLYSLKGNLDNLTSDDNNLFLGDSMRDLLTIISQEVDSDKRRRLILTLATCLKSGDLKTIVDEVEWMERVITLLETAPELKNMKAANGKITAYQAILDISIRGLNLPSQENKEVITMMRDIINAFSGFDDEKDNLIELGRKVNGNAQEAKKAIKLFHDSYFVDAPSNSLPATSGSPQPAASQAAAPVIPQPIPAPVGPQPAFTFSEDDQGILKLYATLKTQRSTTTYRPEKNNGGAVSVGYSLSQSNPLAKIGIMLAANSGLPGGNLNHKIMKHKVAVNESDLGNSTQEEAVWAAAILASCGTDLAKQERFHRHTIDKKWGFQNINSKETMTIQGIDFTDKNLSAEQFNESYVVTGCPVVNVLTKGKKGKEYIREMIPGQTFVADFFFADAPNAKSKGVDANSTMTRTCLADAKANNAEFFFNCVKTKLRSSLDAMASQGITHPLIALLGCGIYAPAGYDFKQMLEFFQATLQELLDEQVGPKGEKRGEYFTDVIIPML